MPNKITRPTRLSDTPEFHALCKTFQVDPKTLLTLPVPDGHIVLWKQPQDLTSNHGLIFVTPEKITDYLVDGWEFVHIDIYYKRDEGFVEANPHLRPSSNFDLDDNGKVAPVDVEPSPPVQVLPPAPSFTQDDIRAKIDEHYKYLDHAFALLGKDPMDPKGPRSRFARFVTGDFKDEGKNFRAKSLQHDTAGRCFYRFIKNTSYKSHVDLARDIVLDYWEHLEDLLEAECYALPKRDDVWLDRAVILGVSSKAFNVEGWGWLPKSKIKFVKGKLVIPAWIAQNIMDKKGKENE